MADNEELMSPDASPDAVRKSGVRRVNNLPLIIAGCGLALFIFLIAMVAVKRSNQQGNVQEDVSDIQKKNTDTSAMANDIVGGHGSGLIPATPLQVPSSNTATTNTAGVPIAPVDDPNIPPVPPRNGANGAAAPIDPDLQQIRMAKMQQFQDAVKAKTNIPLPNQLGSGGPMRTASTGNGPQSREETLAQIANVRRQIDANAASSDPSAAYQAQLAKIRASLGGGGGGSMGSSGGPQLLQASSNRNDVSQYGDKGQGDRWKLDSEVQAPRSQFEIRAGAVIPGVMISGVNSDLPGQIMGQVSQDVYDTARGDYLLIPQGTRLVGSYSSNVAYGQNAILIAWQRMVFPDGKALDISAMPGADMAGYGGFRDQVNNHYLRIFGSALLMSGVTATASYATDRNSNSNGNSFNTQPTASSELSQALGQQLGQVTGQMISKNLNIAPTLEIRPGYRFNIIVVKDLDFTTPYKSFDY